MPTKPEPFKGKPDVEGHALKGALKGNDEADALRDPEALKEAEANREPDVEGHMLKAPTKPATKL
jgi:hypothetical protein